MLLLNKVKPCLEINNENISVFPYPRRVKSTKEIFFTPLFPVAESVSDSSYHLLLLQASIIAQSPFSDSAFPRC